MIWQIKTLDELGFVARGKSKHRPRGDKKLYGGKYPLIQTGDIQKTDFYISEYTNTYNDVGLAQSKLWKKGTLCLSIVGANTAESAILGFDACFPDSVIGFIANPEMSNEIFIKYYFDTMKLQMRKISDGGARENLSMEKLFTFKIPTPPVIIQNKIASILSSYDELIENNKQRIKLLEEMADEIYKEWFVRFRFPGYENAKNIDGLPVGWEKKSVIEIIERYPAGKKYDNNTALNKGNVPILDQGQSGLIGYHNGEPSVFANMEDPIIIFANHTCYQRLIQFNFSAIQNILPFKSNDEYKRNIYWLHFATKDIIEFNDYKGHWPEFSNKKLILPDEKTAIKFGDIIKPLVDEIYLLEQKIQILQETRDLLLPKLINGKLSVEHLLKDELKMVAEPSEEYK